MSKFEKIKSYVPEMISSSGHYQELYSTQGVELDELELAIQDLLNQLYIDTATWGLNRWESFLGIQTDESKSYDYRRSVIKSKVRGVGTVTVSLLKSIANSFENGEVDVIEHNNQDSFEIKFISALGEPPNLQDLKNAIEEVQPAHLGVTYTYKYLLVTQVSALTLNQIQGRKLTDFAPFTPLI